MNEVDADHGEDDALEPVSEGSEQEQSDDGHEPLEDGQDAPDEAGETAEMPEGGYELPLELRQELHEANAAYEAAHSVNAVTPGVKNRLNNAKQAAGVMRRKGASRIARRKDSSDHPRDQKQDIVWSLWSARTLA